MVVDSEDNMKQANNNNYINNDNKCFAKQNNNKTYAKEIRSTVNNNVMSCCNDT